MKKVKVSGAVFTFLHWLILEEFKQQCSAVEVDADSLEKFQLYGYGSSIDPERPSLPSFIAKNARVKSLLASVGKDEINGQYLYSRVNKFKHNKHAAPITLAGIYSKIYFFYLGFDNIDDFLDNMPPGIGRPTEEEIEIQRYLNGKPRSQADKERYIVDYYCTYYTKIRSSLNVLDMRIDYTPALIDPAESKYPAYKVLAKEVATSENQFSPAYRLKVFEGKAVHRLDTLSITLSATDGDEDRLIILTVGNQDDDEESQKVSGVRNPLMNIRDIRGAYCGRSSHHNQAIAGELMVTKIYKKDQKVFQKNRITDKIEEVHDPLDAFHPSTIEYLKRKASQERSKQEPITITYIENKILEMGYGPKMDKLVGENYRLFVLNKVGKLSEIFLKIKEDCTYEMNMAKGRKYAGRVRFMDGDILAFEKTQTTPPEDDLRFLGQAYVEIKDNSASDLSEGVFVWRHNKIPLTTDRCAMIATEKEPIPRTYSDKDTLDEVALKAKELLQSSDEKENTYLFDELPEKSLIGPSSM